MARKFLFVIAACVALILAAGITWSLFSDRMIRFAMVPSTPFAPQAPVATNAYADKTMWIARPDLPGNPAQWTPPGWTDGAKGDAAIFYIHPTSYLDKSAWNAPLNDAAANDRANLFVKSQATVFNAAGDMWVPRYRQATFGAFLTSQPEAQRALDLAYGDVFAAFDHFVASIAPNRAIILAGHSQGSVHLVRLLRERIAGKPLAKRIVAAYVIGWPVSVEADVPALGLPTCQTADQAGCILSWQSFAEPADPSQIRAIYDASNGFVGKPRRGTKMLCSNPLTGVPDSAADARANSGTLVPSADFESATIESHRVPARCDAHGFLLIGPPPAGIGRYVLPGNNYHVFDYPLFWANVRIDAARRLKTFEGR